MTPTKSRRKPPKHKMIVEPEEQKDMGGLSKEEIEEIEAEAELDEEERKRKAIILKARRRRYRDLDVYRKDSRWLTPDEIAAKEEVWEG